MCHSSLPYGESEAQRVSHLSSGTSLGPRGLVWVVRNGLDLETAHLHCAIQAKNKSLLLLGSFLGLFCFLSCQRDL